jgi:hypothetical protein
MHGCSSCVAAGAVFLIKHKRISYNHASSVQVIASIIAASRRGNCSSTTIVLDVLFTVRAIAEACNAVTYTCTGTCPAQVRTATLTGFR